MTPVIPYNYNFNIKKLLEIYNQIKPELSTFMPGHDNWTQYVGPVLFENPYTKSVLDGFAKILPRNKLGMCFIRQKRNTSVRVHIDPACRCAINYVLTGTKGTIFYPKVGEYQYTLALINTSIPHGIQADSEDRVIFKIAIFEEFEKIKSILFDAV